MSAHNSNRQLLDATAGRLINRNTMVRVSRGIKCRGRVIPTGHLSWNGELEQLALAEAKKLSPEALGRIICVVDNADLYAMHGQPWLDDRDSGISLLWHIAATVIVRHIYIKLGVDVDD